MSEPVGDTGRETPRPEEMPSISKLDAAWTEYILRVEGLLKQAREDLREAITALEVAAARLGSAHWLARSRHDAPVETITKVGAREAREVVARLHREGNGA